MKVLMYGKLLLDNGYIEQEYIESMKEKVLEHPYTTYLPGAGVAIPHGMSDGFKHVKNTGISVLQIPNGVDWLDEKVYIVIAIAANSDEHMNVLASQVMLLNQKKMHKNFGEQIQ